MKLNPEGVEKAARAFVVTYMLGGGPDRTKSAVEDALTAYFYHLKQEGLMRVSDVKGRNSNKVVASRVIIRTDKE